MSQVTPSVSRWSAEALKGFLAQLALSKSAGTVASYGYDVARFLEYLAEAGVRRASSFRGGHVIGYLGKCKEGGSAEASVNRYYMSIRAFCKWLRRTKVVEGDVMEDVPAPKVRQKAPRVPTVAEIEAVLASPDVSTEWGCRDRAVLELLYSSGLRASELCDLRVEDYDGYQVRVSCGKRGKTRSVPVTEAAFKAINAYLKEWRGMRSGWLFESVLLKKMRRQVLGEIVRKHAMRAGVESVTPHTLRHACATHLLDAGADLRLIQEVLGHSSISSTERYTHLSSSKLQEKFHAFHPRKREADGCA